MPPIFEARKLARQRGFALMKNFIFVLLIVVGMIAAGRFSSGLSDREERMLIEISDLQAALQKAEARVKELESKLPSQPNE